MKQLTAYTLTLLFGVTLFFSCKKDEPEEDPITVSCDQRTNKIEQVRQLIAGRYEWAYTREVSRLRGVNIYTPESTHTTHNYVFDRNGNVSFYENGKLVWEKTYEIDYEFKVSLYYLDSNAMVLIKTKETQNIERHFRPYICNDSVMFYNPYSSVDNFYYYKRERL